MHTLASQLCAGCASLGFALRVVMLFSCVVFGACHCAARSHFKAAAVRRFKPLFDRVLVEKIVPEVVSFSPLNKQLTELEDKVWHPSAGCCPARCQ
jgi:hypothetical protein